MAISSLDLTALAGLLAVWRLFTGEGPFLAGLPAFFLLYRRFTRPSPVPTPDCFSSNSGFFCSGTEKQRHQQSRHQWEWMAATTHNRREIFIVMSLTGMCLGHSQFSYLFPLWKGTTFIFPTMINCLMIRILLSISNSSLIWWTFAACIYGNESNEEVQLISAHTYRF